MATLAFFLLFLAAFACRLLWVREVVWEEGVLGRVHFFQLFSGLGWAYPKLREIWAQKEPFS
jgi:hypothetical protein